MTNSNDTPNNSPVRPQDRNPARDPATDPKQSGQAGAQAAGSKPGTAGGTQDAVATKPRGDDKQTGRNPAETAANHGDRSSNLPSSPQRQAASGRDPASAMGSDSKDPRHQNSSRSSSNEAVECLVACLEQIVQELPRGAAAKLDGAKAQLQKARAALKSSGASSSLSNNPANASGRKEGAQGANDRDSSKSRGAPSSSQSDDLDRDNASEQSANSIGR